MRQKIKTSFILCFSLILTLSSIFFTGCGKSAQEFYDFVVSAKTNIDSVAYDTYNLWYNYTYDRDSYEVVAAQVDIKTEMKKSRDKVRDDYKEIKKMYNKLKNSEQADEIKAVVDAYSDYYDLVIDLNVSLTKYVINMATYQKALDKALQDLAIVL